MQIREHTKGTSMKRHPELQISTKEKQKETNNRDKPTLLGGSNDIAKTFSAKSEDPVNAIVENHRFHSFAMKPT